MVIDFTKKRAPNTEYALVRKVSDNSIVGNCIYPILVSVDAYRKQVEGNDPVKKKVYYFGTTNKRGYFEGIKIDKLEIV